MPNIMKSLQVYPTLLVLAMPVYTVHAFAISKRALTPYAYPWAAYRENFGEDVNVGGIRSTDTISSPENEDTKDKDDVDIIVIKGQLQTAALSLYSVKPAANAFYGALELTTAALGAAHVASAALAPLGLLLVSIKAAEVAVDSLGKASTIPAEVSRFENTLELVRVSVERTMEECSGDGCDVDSFPPQVLELTQLINEGEQYLVGLANQESFVTTLTRQLLQGDECPASKLSRLSVEIQQAEARMQLTKSVVLLKKHNREEVESLKFQMEQLQNSVKQLTQVKISNSDESPDAKEIHELLRAMSVMRRIGSILITPLALIMKNGFQEKQSTKLLGNLKNPKTFSKVIAKAIPRDTDTPERSEQAISPNIIQEFEDLSLPLRTNTPIPVNEQKRLQVLRDLRLVQGEMDDMPVGDGFEYHRTEIIRTIVGVLQQTLPAFFEGRACLQVVGDQDAYSITGDHGPVTVTPRSQVPCQHVMCLTGTDKSILNVDGFSRHDVLAINLRKKHKELTKNYSYPPEIVSYIGAAVRVNGVTIGSLCTASTKTIEAHGWTDEDSRYVRTVAGVLEEQLTRLCVDWKAHGGFPSEKSPLDFSDIYQLIAEAEAHDK